MLIPVLFFAVGLVLLIKGGDWFVDGATGIAHKFKIPELLIGATVVSIGTTLPEVMVSATSAIGGNGSMAYGNAIGSIICNTSLIAAITIAIRPAKVDRKSLIFPVAFFFGMAIFYSAVAYFYKEFSFYVGIVLLLGFVAYMTVLVIKAFKEMKAQKADVSEAVDAPKEEAEDENEGSNGDSLGLIIAGIALLAVEIIAQIINGALSYFSLVTGIIVLLIGFIKLIIKKAPEFLNSNMVYLIIR